MKNTTQITLSQLFKNRILWRVYTIWFFRRIVPLILFEIIVLVVALKLLANMVFVGKVIENAALASGSNYWAFFKYLLAAYFQTHPAVQIAIIVGLGLVALLLRDLVRAIAKKPNFRP